MKVYEAIDQMRRLTEKGIPFAFAYMSYSRERKQSEGIVSVHRAKLRSQSKRERNQYTDLMLNYVDLDIMEYRTCWQPLLLEFNGEPLTLDDGR